MMHTLDKKCRMKVRRSGVAFLAFICLGTNVYAQTLSGTVADRDTGGPLAGVSVQLFDANGRPVAVEVTDSNGFYTMPLGTPGVYSIVARGWGYERAELGPLEVSADNTVNLWLNAMPQNAGAYELHGVVLDERRGV